jgi:branched-chain amino acid transport system substrate-binding protein
MIARRLIRRRTPTAKAVAAVAASLVVAFSVAACGSSGGSSSPSSSSSSSPSSGLGTSLHVGFDAALSGFLAPFDSLVTNGAQIAVQQINAAGGINGKTKINLDIRDQHSDAATVVTVAHDLIDSGAKILLPGCNLDFQVAVASIAQQQHVPVFSPCNAAPTVTDEFSVYNPVGVGGNRQVAALLTYVSSKGYKTIWVLNSNGNGYVKTITKYILSTAPLYNMKVIGQDQYTVSGTDFSSNVAKIQAANPKPDAIVTGAFAPDISVFVKQLRAAGVNTPVFGTDGVDTPVAITAGGNAVNGLTFTTFAFPQPGSATAKLYAEYEAKYHSKADSAYVTLGYNAIKVLTAAVGKANSTDPGAIRKALAGLNVSTPAGDIKYPTSGAPNPTVPVSVVTVQGGKFKLVKQINPTKVAAP